MSEARRPASLARRVLSVACLAIVLAAGAGPADANASLDPVRKVVPDLRMLGQGVMTWFGLRLYEAALWAPDDRLDWRRPFALDIRYARAFSGARLARASADEMKRLGMRDSARLARWQAEMAAVFPDVEAGDHITGLYRPGEGAEFFHNGQLAGRIDDPEFARTFFGIWLDPRTREPDLRADLLGAR